MIKLTEDDKKNIEHFWYDYKEELTKYGYFNSLSKVCLGMKRILKNQEKAEKCTRQNHSQLIKEYNARWNTIVKLTDENKQLKEDLRQYENCYLSKNNQQLRKEIYRLIEIVNRLKAKIKELDLVCEEKYHQIGGSDPIEEAYLDDLKEILEGEKK